MNRHPHSLLAAAAAVLVLAGCASPSATRTQATASQPPAATPAAAPAVAAAPAPTGTAGGVEAGTSRSVALAPAPAPAPTPPAAVAPAQPESASVFFEFDQSRIRQEDLAVVERFGRYLNSVAAASGRVEGHADERGSREYNLALGQRRAQAVVDALKVLGVADQRLEAVSYGEERPRARGSDEAAWAQNRRADVSIQR